MKLRIISTLFLLVVISSSMSRAQEQTIDTRLEQDTFPSPEYQHYFGSLDSLYNDTLPMLNLELDPDYYRLFVPLAYYYAPIKQISEISWHIQPHDTLPGLASTYLPFEINNFNKTERINKAINNVLIKMYVTRPDLVVNTETQIMSRQTYRKEEVPLSPSTSVIDLFKPDIAKEDVGTANMLVRKPNFWYRGGSSSFQMSQTYISKNWYKGGESNASAIGNFQLFANYNDKEKLQIENLLEIKIGINTVSEQLDTMRIYRINTDVFRLSSKIGLQAFSKWYYTISGEFNTQMFHNYTANTNNLISSFLSPANVAISVGMDYKLIKKRINLSVVISPFSYNWRYIENEKVDGTRYGLEAGKHSLSNLGSKLQGTLTWIINPTVTLNSRLLYFTNYKKIEAEWENTVNFVLNRYLSTKIFIHPRYDDGIRQMEGYSHLQMNELFSFGLNYRW